MSILIKGIDMPKKDSVMLWVLPNGIACVMDDSGQQYKAIEIIQCKDCYYGEQDEEGWWYCRNFGCVVGNDDGSGFCADAERRTDDV